MNIFGSIGAVVMLIIMLPVLLRWVDTGLIAQQQRVVSTHLSMVTRAARQYVNKHQDTLLTRASASAGPTVSINDLITDGFLNEGFASHNAWLQEYQIYVRQPRSGSLQAIVLTTGGRNDESAKFQNMVVPGAAALVGGAGGYVASGLVAGQSTNTLIGAGNGWILDLPSVGIASPGAGHLGSVTTYDSSALDQDFLYRVPVPGQPELNAMQTTLDMTDHALDNVSEITFTERQISSESCTSAADQGRIFLDRTQGLYLCRNHSLEILGDSGNSMLMKSATVAKNGDKITKPSCATKTGTSPYIYTAPAIIEAGAVAPPMTSVQTWATSLSATQWQVHMRVQTPNKKLTGADANGWVYPTDNYGKIFVLTMCAKN